MVDRPAKLVRAQLLIQTPRAKLVGVKLLELLAVGFVCRHEPMSNQMLQQSFAAFQDAVASTPRLPRQATIRCLGCECFSLTAVGKDPHARPSDGLRLAAVSKPVHTPA